MGYIVDKNGIKWFNHKYPDGSYLCVKLGAISPGQAEVERERRNQQIKTGQSFVSDQDSKIAEVFKLYRLQMEREGKKESTLYNSFPYQRDFIATMSTVKDWTDVRIRKWRDILLAKKTRLGNLLAPDTIIYAMRMLRHFHNWMGKNGHIAKRPFPVEIKRGRQDAGRALSIDEVHRFIERAPEPIKLFTSFIFNTGGRAREVLAARYEHIDREKGLWVIPEAKTGKNQVVVLSQSLLAIIPDKKKGWLIPSLQNPDEPLGYDALRNYWKLGKVAAGITGRLRIHDARVTYATHYYEKNRSMHGLMKQLRWTSERTALGYMKLPDEIQQQQANNLFLG